MPPPTAFTAPPAPPLPPYASAAYPPPPQGSPPQGAVYGAGYPMSTFPPEPPKSSGRTLGIVLAAVGAFVVLIVVGIAVVVGLLVSSRTPEPVSAPAPAVTAAPTAPSDEPSTEDPPSDDSGDVDASGIADVLQAKIDEYKRLRDSGALWESIPDTEFNRTAVSAFLYFLTDMKVATIWGVDEAQAQEYEERMTMLEERLLAEQPLGDDIQITLEDEVFTYDGETGEGGYTAR
ncbi:hypothetical protein [Microbacterium sp. NPDC087589]|uniref:hypothetical protein n=1 Tax=Microbacterium sp. NPDC087589 TaxID=3364191 RepID=UPI003810A6BD